jgi:hypothetical protein
MITSAKNKPAKDDSEILHSEFRTLITILNLVTAFNNHGFPMLKQDFIEGYRPLFDGSFPNTAILANAFAAILVLEYEVIAVAPRRSRSQSDSSQTQSQSGEDDLLIWEDTAPTFEDASAINGFVIVQNADINTVKSHKPPYFLSQKGTSHFDLISKDNWKCLTIS